LTETTTKTSLAGKDKVDWVAAQGVLQEKTRACSAVAGKKKQGESSRPHRSKTQTDRAGGGGKPLQEKKGSNNEKRSNRQDFRYVIVHINDSTQLSPN